MIEAVNDPKFKEGDTVRYNGRQGRVVEKFKERTHPSIQWRYYVSLRDGVWSVGEESIEKLVKRSDDES